MGAVCHGMCVRVCVSAHSQQRAGFLFLFLNVFGASSSIISRVCLFQLARLDFPSLPKRFSGSRKTEIGGKRWKQRAAAFQMIPVAKLGGRDPRKLH